MIIPSNYEVNIARRNIRYSGPTCGHPPFIHFCKAELGQLLETEVRSRFAILCLQFPADKGWQLTLNRIKCSGQETERREAGLPTGDTD